MEKIIYVTFYSENQYLRQQFFKEVNKEKYYGRDHFLLWHTVLLENEKFILEMVVPKKIKFVICNDINEQIFTSSNDKKETLFPLLRYRALAEWEKMSSNYSVILENTFSLRWNSESESNLAKELLSIKNIKKISEYNDEEWILSFQEQIGDKEILKMFSYCGKIMEIYRICKKHTICNAVWYEYYSGYEFVGIELLKEGIDIV